MRRVCLAVLLSGVLGMSIPAQAEIQILETVVVTATRTPRAESHVAPSVTVITAEEIAASGAQRVQEVLRDVVGLTVVETGAAGAVATVSIRGSEAQQVLVLLDGVRLNSPQLGQADLANLPIALDDIERIEVLRGPASSLYGSNAMGGVIQIFTRRPTAEPLTRFTWKEARHDTRELGFSTARKLGSVGYRMGASRNHSQGFRENSDLDQTTLDGLLSFDLPGGFELATSVYHLQKENGVPGPEGWPSPQARQTDENTALSVALEGPTGPVAWTARGTYERIDNGYTDPAAFTPVADRHLAETYGAEWQGDARVATQTITLGGDFFRDFLDSTANGDRDQGRWAVFGQDELGLGSWAALLLGLRYDAHSEFRNQWSPRASLLLSPAGATQIRVSAGRAYRAPTFNDRYWPFDGFTRGNPELEPETAWEYELGATQALGRWGSVSGAGFRRDAEDLIDWQPEDPTDPFSVWSPVNVGTSRTWGAEVSVELTPCAGLGLGGNYTWLHAVNRETREFLPGKPRHSASAYVGVELFWDLQLRFQGRYARYSEEPARSERAYTVFDASLARPFYVGEAIALDLTAGVENLFDRDYQLNPGYPMPPRQGRVGVTASF